MNRPHPQRIANPGDPRIDAYRNVKERDLTGRLGRFVAEGRVVLNVLVEHAPLTIESLLVLENRMQGIGGLLEKLPAAVPVYVAAQPVMDAIAGFHLHRGVLAIARQPTPPDFVSFAASMGDDALALVLAGISNHDNMGAIFRNAAVFDADAVFLDQTCCDPFYRKAIRVSVGAVLKVPHIRAGPIDEILDSMTAAGFSLFAMSPRGSMPVGALPKTGKRALVLGTEGEGLPESILARLQTCKIPMSAGFDSLNAATASGLALFHASRFSM